jgi:hypothetical protein
MTARITGVEVLVAGQFGSGRCGWSAVVSEVCYCRRLDGVLIIKIAQITKKKTTMLKWQL